jgi:membrane protein implicated in regulation of membrane protease activity
MGLMSSVLGCTGTVTIATHGQDGPGEVEVDDNHGLHIAWSKVPLPRGTCVLIIGTRGVRTVSVEPFGE